MSRRGPDHPDNTAASSFVRPGELVQGEEEQVNVITAPHASSSAAAASAAAAASLGQQQQQQQYGVAQKGGYKLPNAVYGTLVQAIDATTQGDTLHALWQRLYRGDIPGETLNVYLANKMMSAALKLELPDLAVDIFEASFGFHHTGDLDINDFVSDNGNTKTTVPQDTSGGSSAVACETDDVDCILEMVYSSSSEQPPAPGDFSVSSVVVPAPAPVPTNQGSGHDSSSKPISAYFTNSFLEPNNFVCTTAVKAYGRKGQVLQPYHFTLILSRQPLYSYRRGGSQATRSRQF